MSDFSFLDNLELSEVKPIGVRKAKIDQNPIDADLRVFESGEVYPSAALVEEFKLEYPDKDSEDSAFGFDVIDSADWSMIPEGTPRFVALAVVSKSLSPKPMLFGRSKYNSEGKPMQPVIDQGSATSGKDLLDIIVTAFDFKFEAGDRGYVDINIHRDKKISSNNGVYSFPRPIKKGEKAGTLNTIKRQGCDIYPISLEVPPVKKAEPSQQEVEGIGIAYTSDSFPEETYSAVNEPQADTQDEPQTETQTETL